LESSVLVIDTVVLGRLGRGNLAAFAIGTAYFNVSWLFIEGVLTAQDTLSAQAVGMSNVTDLRCWLLVAAAVSVVLCAMGTVLFCFSYMVFVDVFQVATHIAFKGTIHVLLLIPNLWLLAAFRVLQKYLMAQDNLQPVVVCTLLGSIIKLVTTYVLVDAVHLGFMGSGLATSATRACMLAGLVYYVVRRPDYTDMRTEVLAIAQSSREQVGPFVRWGIRALNARARGRRVQAGDEGGMGADDNDDGDDGDDEDNNAGRSSRRRGGDDEVQMTLVGAARQPSAPSPSGAPGTHPDPQDPPDPAPARAFLLKAVQFILLGMPGGCMLALDTWVFDATLLLNAQQVGLGRALPF
jgi:hypothetical protein